MGTFIAENQPLISNELTNYFTEMYNDLDLTWII